MATYEVTIDSPPLWPPGFEAALTAFALTAPQSEGLRRTPAGRWCMVMHGRELARRLPDTEWDARRHGLVWCEPGSSELRVHPEVSALHDVRGERLLVTLGNGTVRHLAELDLVTRDIVRVLAPISSRETARWLHGDDNVERLVVADASTLTLLAAHDGELVAQARVGQGGSPVALPGGDVVALRSVDSKGACWWRLVSTCGAMLVLDRKTKLDAPEGHRWVAVHEQVFDQDTSGATPARAVLDWRASGHDAPTTMAKMEKKWLAQQKRTGFCFVALHGHHVRRARGAANDDSAASPSTALSVRFEPTHDASCTGTHAEGSLDVVLSGAWGERKVQVPTLNGAGHTWPGLLGLSADLPLVQQRFIAERQTRAVALDDDSALLVTPSGARLFLVDLASGATSPVMEGERQATLEHLQPCAEVHAAFVLSEGRFVVVSNASVLMGSVRDGVLSKIVGGTSAVLLRGELLFVAHARPHDQRLDAEKLFDRTVVTAYDVTKGTLREWYSWDLPGRGLELLLVEDELLAGDTARTFLLQDLALGWRWFESVFRDGQAPPGTSEAERFARTPAGPPDGWKSYTG